MPDTRAYSLDEVGELLGIGRTLAWKLPRMGLRTFKIGKLRRVRPEDLDEFLAQQVAAESGEWRSAPQPKGRAS